MKKLILSILGCAITILAHTQNLSPEAAFLFKGIKCKLSNSEKNLIASSTGKLSSDKSSLTVEGTDIDVSVYPVDFNNDGIEEIILIIGSSFLYGNTGQGFSIFVKNKSNQYSSIFDSMGIPQIATISGKQYPDILVAGPGFEYPVYSWNGKNYVITKKVKDGVAGFSDVDEISVKYTSTIK